MHTIPYRLIVLLLVFSIPMGIGYAADESARVKAWLQKMVQAERSLSYRGTFVYHHRGEMVAMQIVRAMGEKGMLEYLTSLNGTPGEVIRSPLRVKYLESQSAAPIIYDNPKVKADVMGDWHAHIGEIERYYRLSIAEVERVAGRMAQKVVITPRDEYRYGTKIWIDQQSGLLLKSKHLGVDGEVLEQMIYSNLEIFDKEIPREVLQLFARKPTGDIPVMKLSHSHVSDNANNWAVQQIPNGFALANYQRRNDARQTPFEHIVFSDGLASISVFIEKQASSDLFSGVSQRGAMNAYLATVDDYQVVVVGEVPLVTLELIGESVRHSSIILR